MGSVDGAPPLGSVNIGPGTTMASVRVLIRERNWRAVPGEYLFVRDGMPVPKDDEGSHLAQDFTPQVVITAEEMKSRRRSRNETALAIRDRSPPRKQMRFKRGFAHTDDSPSR